MSRKGGRIKGQNLNHLLNFHYEERPKASDHSEARKTRGRIYRRQGNNEPFDKSKFIAANFRFVLDPQSVRTRVLTVSNGKQIPGLSLAQQQSVMASAEASKASAKEVANTLNFAENWQDVQSVVVHCTQAQCPICLESARVPRVTNCGHVYCLVCMMLYLATYDSKSYPRCPICFEPLDVNDLRQAIIKESPSVAVNSNAEFALLCSRKGEAIPLVLGKDCRAFYGLPLAHTTLALYSRVSVATQEFMVPVLEAELDDMAYVLDEAIKYEDHSRMMFARDLRKQIEDNLISWKRRKGIPEQELDDLAQNIFPTHPDAITALVQQVPADEKPSEIETTSTAKRNRKSKNNKTGKQHPKKSTQPVTPPPVLRDLKGEERYFCYQSTSGQFAVLHPFNVDCLMYQEKLNPLRLPQLIKGPVVAVAEKQLTTDLIRKNPSLAHIPLMAIILEIELELDDVLDEATKVALKSSLKQRQKQREIKLRKEKEEAARAKAKELQMEAMHRQPEFVNDDMDPELLEALALSAATSQPSASQVVPVGNSSQQSRVRQSSIDMAGSPPNSFASIVTNMGHYPSLGESSTAAAATEQDAASSGAPSWEFEVLGGPGSSSSSPPTAGGWARASGWGSTSSPLPSNAVPLIPPTVTFADMANKKGTKQSVFTNSSRRGYR